MSSDVKAGGGEPRRIEVQGAATDWAPVVMVPASAFDAVVAERDERDAALKDALSVAEGFKAERDEARGKWAMLKASVATARSLTEIERDHLRGRVRVLAEAHAKAVEEAKSLDIEQWTGARGVLQAWASALASVADSDPEGAHEWVDYGDGDFCANCRATRRHGGVGPDACVAPASSSGGAPPEGRGDGHRLRFEFDGDERPIVKLVCPPNHAGCVPPTCEHGEPAGAACGCPPSKEPCWAETWEGADTHYIEGVVEVPVTVAVGHPEDSPEFTIVGPPVSSAAVDEGGEAYEDGTLEIDLGGGRGCTIVMGGLTPDQVVAGVAHALGTAPVPVAAERLEAGPTWFVTMSRSACIPTNVSSDPEDGARWLARGAWVVEIPAPNVDLLRPASASGGEGK